MYTVGPARVLQAGGGGGSPGGRRAAPAQRCTQLPAAARDEVHNQNCSTRS